MKKKLFWFIFGALVACAIGASITQYDVITVTDEAYGSSWDGSLAVPTKNAIYDKIEASIFGGNVTNLTDWQRLVVTNTTGTENILMTNGAIAATASIDSTGGSVRAGTAGAAATPSLGWNLSAGGFYLPSSADLHVTVNGINVASFNSVAPSLQLSNGLQIISGTLNGQVGYFGNYVSATNGIRLPTNTAPTSVTVGTTAPDSWITFTNHAGLRLKIPAWIEH